MHGAELAILIVVGTVLAIGAVAIVADRIGVAAPLLLVAIGIAVGAIPGVPEVDLDPEIILAVVLPPLLYAAARQVPFVDFRRNLWVIGMLAIVLVAVSAVVVGAVVHLLWAAVPFALAIALGAVVAPPDAVAAISLGKRLGLPPRIVTILEGEGLVNDAAALVLLSTALSIATAGAGDVTGWSVAGGFLWSVIGAVAVGWLLGRIGVEVRARVSNGVFDAALSLSLPFLAYLGAELIGASGIVSVVAAGIVIGNSGAFRIGAALRQAESTNWRTFAALVENAVFLYMGFQLWPVLHDVGAGVGSALGLALIVTALLVALRFAAMPPLLWAIRRRYRRAERRHSIVDARVRQVVERHGPAAEAHIAGRIDRIRDRLARSANDLTAERDRALGWRDGVIVGLSGMRGVVTVAAAHTIPHDEPLRSPLIFIAYTVAVLTLVAQGLLLPVVIRRLRPADDATAGERVEVLELRRRMHSAGAAELERAAAGLEHEVAPEVAGRLRARAEAALRRTELWSSADLGDPGDPLVLFARLRRRELDAQRAALRGERERGEFSSEAIAWMAAALDAEEIELDTLTRAESGEQ